MFIFLYANANLDLYEKIMFMNLLYYFSFFISGEMNNNTINYLSLKTHKLSLSLEKN